MHVTCWANADPGLHQLLASGGLYWSSLMGAGKAKRLIDTATGAKHIFVGDVPPPLIAKWEQHVGDQLICQTELYALVVNPLDAETAVSPQEVSLVGGQ